MTNCIIASTSTLHGSEPLAYLQDTLIDLYSGIEEILLYLMLVRAEFLMTNTP